MKVNYLMNLYVRYLLVTALALCIQIYTPSTIASDSPAMIKSGNLQLISNDMISLDSEEVFISPYEVLVKNHFTNHSDKEIEISISFPILDFTQTLDQHVDGEANSNDDSLDFDSKIEDDYLGSDDLMQSKSWQPEVHGYNVSSRLSELAWPEFWYLNDAFIQKINSLSSNEKQRYIDEGLLRRTQIRRVQKDERLTVLPNWVQTLYLTRSQKFPAHATTNVEYHYKPFSGYSYFANNLDIWQRSQDSFKKYADRYCIKTDFMSDFENGKNRYSHIYRETWLHYSLKPSANWKGPIKRFKLVIEKESSRSILSTCMENMRQISPTQYEIELTDYEPDEDIDILLVDWCSGLRKHFDCGAYYP